MAQYNLWTQFQSGPQLPINVGEIKAFEITYDLEAAQFDGTADVGNVLNLFKFPEGSRILLPSEWSFDFSDMDTGTPTLVFDVQVGTEADGTGTNVVLINDSAAAQSGATDAFDSVAVDGATAFRDVSNLFLQLVVVAKAATAVAGTLVLRGYASRSVLVRENNTG